MERREVENGKLKVKNLPDGWKKIRLKFLLKEKMMLVFDKDFFNSRNEIEVCKTPKSFCAHNYAGSWQKQDNGGFKKQLPKWLLKLIIRVGHLTWARSKFVSFQIPFEKHIIKV